jgi:1,4-alpha-glucan branching enzyme
MKVNCCPKPVFGGTLFSYAATETDSVEIAGDFNNWQPQKLNTPGLSDSIWMTVLPLQTGVYKYKYIVNGEWVLDPDNYHREPNAFSGEDCVIAVP